MELLVTIFNVLKLSTLKELHLKLHTCPRDTSVRYTSARTSVESNRGVCCFITTCLVGTSGDNLYLHGDIEFW